MGTIRDIERIILDYGQLRYQAGTGDAWCRHGGRADIEAGNRVRRSLLATIAEALGPLPDCETCGGSGEYYWHSDGCADDLCALAGGWHDCRGQVVRCECWRERLREVSA